MTIYDQNGNRVTRSIRRNASGNWEVTVYFGGLYGFATNVRRIEMRTRAAARRADISDYSEDPDYIGPAISHLD